MQQDPAIVYHKEFEQLNAIKANDETVLKALYKNNYPKLENYVIHNSGSVDEAKDIYQEAFIAVWRNVQLNKFVPSNETALAGYLFQVGKNKWIDYLRSSYYKKIVPIAESDIEYKEADVITADESEYITAVKINFAKLGNNCKEVLENFYYKKLSLKAIAAMFNWTEATARNNKYRCLQRLREMLKK